MLGGAVILLLDLIAVRNFASDALEAVTLAALTLPTGVFILLAGMEARK